MKLFKQCMLGTLLSCIAGLSATAPAQAQPAEWVECEVGAIRLFQQRFTVYCRNTERYYSAPTTGGGVNVVAAIDMLVEAKNDGRQVRIRYADHSAPAGANVVANRPGQERPQGCGVNDCYRLTGLQY
jgi:hypothetical protein